MAVRGKLTIFTIHNILETPLRPISFHIFPSYAGFFVLKYYIFMHVSNSCTGLNRPCWLLEVKTHILADSPQIVLGLSALCPGRTYPTKIFLVFISVTGLVEFRATVRPEGLSQWKIPMTGLGVEPATFILLCICTDIWASQLTLL